MWGGGTVRSGRWPGNRQQAQRLLFTSKMNVALLAGGTRSEQLNKEGLSHTAKVRSSVSKCARLKQRLDGVVDSVQ